MRIPIPWGRERGGSGCLPLLNRQATSNQPAKKSPKLGQDPTGGENTTFHIHYIPGQCVYKQYTGSKAVKQQ